MAVAAVGALMSTASAVITGSGFIFGVTSALTHFLITTAIGAAINALTPKPNFNQVGGYNVTASGSNLDHQIIYGRVRTAGVRVFDGTTGENNNFLHRVVAFTGHEVESFDELWVNDAKVTTLDGDGNVAEVLLADGTTSTVYNGYLRIKTHTGSPTQLADSDLVNEVPDWTDTHRLQGISYIYARFSYSQDVFPNGIPEITATIKGKKVYDPRTDTTVWSDNPALCIRDYIISDYGLKESTDNIDDTLVIAAADVCDETSTLDSTTRYTCNGNFTTGTTPYQILTNILTSMGGLLWYSQGKWRMKPAYWVAPVLTLDENDLRGPIQVSTRHSRRDNFNTINGTFRGEETAWEVTDFPPITNSDFLDADNGQESSIDLSLPFTDNSIEARRIARIALERNRQQLTIQAAFGLRAFQVQVGDNVILNNTRFGWSNKTFEVVSWTFGLVDNQDLQVIMTLREISENVFDEIDDGIIYERDNTTLPSPFFVPSVGVNVTATAQVSNQKITNIANVVVTASTPQFIDKVDVEYKKSSDTNWKYVGSGPLGNFEVLDLEVADYDFRARAVNTLGIRGEWVTLTNIEINPFTGPPSNVTGFIAEVSGNSLFLSWDAIPDPDLSHYIIKHNPAYTGANWTNSNTIVHKVARPSTSAVVPARAGTYLIKAYDKENFLSVTETTLVVLQESLPSLGTIETLTEDPTFSGTKSGVVLYASTLQIEAYYVTNPTGYYLFSSTIDLGTAKQARVTGYTTFSRVYLGSGLILWDSIPQLFDTWPGEFDTWSGGSAGFDDVSAEVYVSTTLDDPASGSAVWTSYELASGAFFTGRGFRFKLVLNSQTAYYSPRVSELSATVEY